MARGRAAASTEHRDRLLITDLALFLLVLIGRLAAGAYAGCARMGAQVFRALKQRAS